MEKELKKLIKNVDKFYNHRTKILQQIRHLVRLGVLHEEQTEQVIHSIDVKTLEPQKYNREITQLRPTAEYKHLWHPDLILGRGKDAIEAFYDLIVRNDFLLYNENEEDEEEYLF